MTSGSVEVGGTGNPGDTIQVFVDAHGPACQATVDPSSLWSCTASALSDGPNVILSAVVAGDATRSDSVSIAVLSPPVVTAPTGNVTSGGIRGTGYPGATVTVTASGGAQCSFPVDGNGSWGCVLSGPPTSGTYTITATQQAPFSTESSRSSAPLAATIDSTAPARPTLLEPATGANIPHGTSVTFRGGGETGAQVVVYGGNDAGSSVLCRATVIGGAWTCQGALPAGRYTVSALQNDLAGNVSPASNAITLTFAAETTASPAPSSSASPRSTAPPASPRSTSPAAPVVPPSTPTPSSKPPRPAHDAPKAWTGGNRFTDASAPKLSPDAFPGWLRALLLAAAALLLFALPARLLAGTVARARSEQPSTPRLRVFGRNRARSELAHEASSTPSESPMSRRLVTIAGFAVAAALIALSSPTADLASFLRVLVAIALALVVVNTAWLAVPRFASIPLIGAHIGIAFRPQTLFIVAGAAVASRVFDLHPALLFGVVVGLTIPPGVSRVAHGRLAIAQVTGLAGVGVLAWLLVGLLPQPADILTAFVTELANSIALIAIGSAAILLVPVGHLAGRAIFLWSRRIWAALSLAVYTPLFALLLPVESLWRGGNAAVVLIVGVIGFAALSVAIWLWERFVEPSRAG